MHEYKSKLYIFYVFLVEGCAATENDQLMTETGGRNLALYEVQYHQIVRRSMIHMILESTSCIIFLVFTLNPILKLKLS